MTKGAFISISVYCRQPADLIAQIHIYKALDGGKVEELEKALAKAFEDLLTRLTGNECVAVITSQRNDS